VLARVGEPFFTTKEPGRGMGLGMFLARAVLERLGGSLTLSSAVGVGTRAVLTLPAGEGARAGGVAAL
jgi:two-component system sensor histidine kinase RegB